MRRRITHPGPNAIDPASGFKVKLDELRPQWDGELVAREFIDPERHPQDFVRGIADRMALPFSRPEAPDRFFAATLQFEDGQPILIAGNVPLQTEGDLQTL
jgi:hypothetical protein